MRRRIRVIFDTNIWISFLITKSMKGVDKLIFDGKATLLFSEELIGEFLDVVNREKLKPYFTKDDIKTMLDLFEEYGELIQVSSKVDICRDKKDNFLLSLAIDSKADYLISGDKDILVINNIGITKITNLTYFLEKHK